MAERYPTTPFDDDPDGDFTFSDATLLALIGVVGLSFLAVFLLGAVCAEHRLAGVLTSL